MNTLVKCVEEVLKTQDRSIKIYEKSVTEEDNRIYSMIREGGQRKLLVIGERAPYENSIFDVEESGVFEFEGSYYSYLICPRNRSNLNVLQSELPWLRPSPLGDRPAVGMGDRTGVCTPGQVKVAKASKKHPVLAQQSIREMKHTNREPRDVVADAAWAVFQEGYKKKWAADADHLKNKENIKECYHAGFSMYTLDPSEHVDNKAKEYDLDTLREKFEDLPWKDLETSPEEYLQRYQNSLNLYDLDLEIGEEDALRTAVKYGHALAHVNDLNEYIEQLHGECDYDLEVSVDETEDPTSLIEHFIIASELRRLGIRVNSLAPRFPGTFEKGADYKGDMDEFEYYYNGHVVIAEVFGYKLSVHSGSDKFSVYPILGKKDEYLHLKTSGTSYLEALRVVARKDPEFFREIIDYARKYFEEERKSYGSLVSAELSEVSELEELAGDELEEIYLDNETGRQILHVTYGSLLTAKKEGNEYIFRKKLNNMLVENEDDYNRIILSHFKDHLEPLGWM